MAAAPHIPEATLGSLLEVATQDGNGPDVYSNERATFGYINESQMLLTCADRGFLYPEPPDIDLVALGKINGISAYLGAAGDAHRAANPYLPAITVGRGHTLKLIMLNFVRLRSGANPLSIPVAAQIAFLRARWIKLGGLYNTLAARGVTHEEVAAPVTADERAILAYNAPDNYLTSTVVGVRELLTFWGTEAGKTMQKDCIKYAETFWCMVEFVFRVRGHHYKESFIPLFKKVFEAVSDGNHPLPEWVDLEAITRIAIHPFGLKALPKLATHFISHGKIGNAAILRMEGAPQGCAFITTTAAAIGMLQTEGWYGQFAELYKEQVAFVLAAARVVMNNKYAYHLSANLYGVPAMRTITVNGVTYSMNEIESTVSSLAPVAQGFIGWTKDKMAEGKDKNATFGFGNAQCLEKRAGSNPVMVMKMQALLELSVNAVLESKSVTSGTAAAFPMIKPKAAPLAIMPAAPEP